MSSLEEQNDQSEWNEEQDRDTAVSSSPNRTNGGLRFDPVLLVVVAVALVGLCLVCFFGYLILQNSFGSNTTEPSTAETGGTTTETDSESGWFSWLFGSSSSTPTAVVTETEGVDTAVLDIAVSGSEPITLTLKAPTNLEIGSERFTVRPQSVNRDQAAWLVNDATSPALWLRGTVVNYVIGLPSTAENRTLLETLNPGTRLAFTAQDGQPFEFVMTQREWTTQPLSELVTQNRPSLTLLWLGQDNNGATLVVRGEYVLNEEEANRAEVVVVQLGEPAQLGTARLTVTGATHLTDQPDIPTGAAFYLVDFTMENVGQTRIDTGLWRFVLVDDVGTQYSLNAQASRQGSYEPLSNTIPPGSQVQATAGYQIPAGLNSELLRWFVNRVDGSGEIEVQIPFRSAGDESAVQISLQQASIGPDNTSFIVQGQIFNQGDQPLTVNEANVRLEGDGATYFMLSTNPAFPWTIPPGQPIPFMLTFQRPNADTATLSILNQSFLLSGLR